jgi:hypothetical protein
VHEGKHKSRYLLVILVSPFVKLAKSVVVGPGSSSVPQFRQKYPRLVAMVKWVIVLDLVGFLIEQQLQA